MIFIAQDGFGGVVSSLENLKEGSSRAAMRALNRGIGSAQTVQTKAIAGDTGLKQKDVRDALTMVKATTNRLEASLAASTKRIPISQFGAKGPLPSRGRGRGVSYKLAGGRGLIPDAFIATMPSGHQGVFVRASVSGKKSQGAWSKNLPIGEKFGPSIGQVFSKFKTDAIARAQESFLTSFDHEMNGAWGGTPVPAGDASDDAGA